MPFPHGSRTKFLPGMNLLDALETTKPLAHPSGRVAIGTSCHKLINRQCLVSMAEVDASMLKNIGLQFSELLSNSTEL